MDSLTQILLGAPVGTVVLHKKAGWKAVFWGGFCGLFPDLDIFIPFGDAVRSFTYHRGFSHSFFVLSALTPLFAGLIIRIHPSLASHRLRWHLLVFLAFITHILLDGLTVYGTQILWPLTTPPVMWSTLFIIDPVYSLPLAFGVLSALLLRSRGRGFKINTVCLSLSMLYIFWSIGAKIHVNGVVRENIESRSISHGSFLTVPAPFNTLLWRIVIVDDHNYYEGFYSLLDPTRKITLSHHFLNRALLTGIENHWPVKRLHWFTHGFHAAKIVQGDIVMADLRMGWEPNYIFQFKVAKMAEPRALPFPNKRYRPELEWEKLTWVWHRIWNPDVDTRQAAYRWSAG